VAIWAFFLDEKPKLKSIFDNVRNYAICATIFAVSAWLKSGAYYVTMPTASRSYFAELFISTAFLVSGIILTLLNAFQTYALLAPGITSMVDWLHDLERKAAQDRQKKLYWLAAEAGRGFAVLFGLTILFMILALVRASYFSISIGHK